ncbi:MULTISPECIES: hypothetical protein, partial [unclassified Streptomyces]|uniref:hypothetical protein n=1 Tax=Streptomyces sp. NPDC055082 TaxID=3365718 RepID=UPI0037D90696
MSSASVAATTQQQLKAEAKKAVVDRSQVAFVLPASWWMALLTCGLVAVRTLQLAPPSRRFHVVTG